MNLIIKLLTLYFTGLTIYIEAAGRCDNVGSNSALYIASSVNCILKSCSDNGTCYQFCLTCQGSFNYLEMK